MKYRYSAKDFTGKTVKGVAEGPSPAAVADALREQKLTPISLTAVQQGFDLSALNSILGKVSANDLTNFTRQLSTMITAGLPITDALSLLKAQSSPAMAKVVGGLLTDVQAGVSLSGAMTKHPKVFSKVYVSLIKAGEAAGVMENILNRLADTSEKSREFRGKVKGAMIYPIIVLIGMVGVMVLMVLVVIPKLTALYADFDAELPAATRAIIWISDFSVKYWWLVLVGIAGITYAVKAYIATAAGRFQWDGMKYKLPVMGPLSREVMLTELTRTMALLVGAGVSVVEALQIVSDAVGNVVVEKDVKRIAHQVEKGFPISISFSESNIFPPIIGQMSAVGEETGKLDDVMAKMSHYFEAESEEKVKGLTTAIEPIILMVLAIGVGFLMYAVVMPIYSITNKF